MEQCSKCKCFERLYTKPPISQKVFLKTRFGICKHRNKAVRDTYICARFEERVRRGEENDR